MSEIQLSIGDLADRTGVSRRTVRFYVQRGLIDPPDGRGRGSAYGPRHIAQIERILRLQREGLALDAIGALSAPPVAAIVDKIEQLTAPGAVDSDEDGSAPVAARPPLPQWVARVTLAPGVRLEVDRDAQQPDAALIAALSAACREVLRAAGRCGAR